MSILSRNNDISTNKYIHATDAGKYAKIFKIKMKSELLPDHTNYPSVYFNVYFDAANYTTMKTYRANARMAGWGVTPVIRLEDMTPENTDFEVVGIHDGTYVTFYMTAPNRSDCNEYRGEVQFTKTHFTSYIEKLGNESFVYDVEDIMADNPTYELVKSIMPPLIYPIEKGVKTPECFKMGGYTQGYTKIFEINFANVPAGTNYALTFSAGLYTSGASTPFVNVYSLYLVYSTGSSAITSAHVAITPSYGSSKKFKELPCIVITNGAVADVYLDHREQANNSAIIHVLSLYQSNSKVITTPIDTAEVIPTLPSGTLVSKASYYEDCEITYSGTWAAKTDYVCKAVRIGNKVTVTLGVTGGKTGTDVEICTLPYNNINRIEVLGIQNDGTTDTPIKIVMPKANPKIYAKALTDTTTVTLQFSYYIS